MKKFLLFLSLFSIPFTMISQVNAASTASETLKSKVVTEGEGLYKDEVTEGRYVYKGANPNNYIKFNNELWRVMAIEKDGTLKIIRLNTLDNNATFDVNQQKPTGNRYCDYAQFGCNAWAKTDSFSNGVYAGVTENGLSGYSGPNSLDYHQYDKTFELKGKVENNSDINDYLNNDYYKKLSENTKNQIIKYDYNIGGVSLKDNVYAEKVREYLGAKNFYESNKKNYENDPNGSNSTYYKSQMEKEKQKMEELKPAYDSYFKETNNIIKGNNEEESKYTWNGNVAMPTLTDVLEATNDEKTCGTMTLVNTNGECTQKDNWGGCANSWSDDKLVDGSEKYGTYAKFRYPTLKNNCDKSNYLIPPETYKFTDYNYLLITPVYNSNELVYSASNQGLNPQYVYQDFGAVYYNSFSIRPVVHLNSSISITGGEGSENSPYTLSNMGGSANSNNITSSITQIVDVPPTSLFTSIFVIVGAVILLAVSGYLYLKVFKKKDISK